MWWLASIGAFACDDVGDAARSAKEAVLGMDVDLADDELERAEVALGCSRATPADLGLMWLVQGAVHGFQGEEPEALEAFSAAARVAPDLWVVDFGPDLQSLYQRARAGVKRAGSVEHTDLPEGYVWLIDGVEREGRKELPVGLHVVQAGSSSREIAFGKIIEILHGERISVATGLVGEQGAAPVIPASPPPRDPPRARSLRLHTALGGEVAIGESLERRTAGGEVVTEPGLKVLLPLEVGVRLDLGDVWMRGAGGGGPVIAGPLLYQSPEGIERAGAALRWHLGGGIVAGRMRVGGLVGAVLPGRQVVRAIGGWSLMPSLELELRAGVNRVGARGIEGGGALMVVFAPTLSTL